jgi:hypothetical protein
MSGRTGSVSALPPSLAYIATTPSFASTAQSISAFAAGDTSATMSTPSGQTRRTSAATSCSR